MLAPLLGGVLAQYVGLNSPYLCAALLVGLSYVILVSVPHKEADKKE